MAKRLSIQSVKKNGGVPAKIGKKFHSEVSIVQIERIRSGKSEDRISVERITNLLVRHKLWPELKKDIINLDEREVNQFGL